MKSLRAGWLILPVVVGGLGHVAVLKTDVLRPLAKPIDAGARLWGQPLFGGNKTWRGIAVMTGLTALASASLGAVGRRGRWAVAVEVQKSARLNPWAAGAVCGLAYCLAELPNSFVKRRLQISPGARAGGAAWPQYIVDQADSVAGCLLPLRLIYRADAAELVTALALGLAVHIGIDQLIYAIGVKSRPIARASARRAARRSWG